MGSAAFVMAPRISVSKGVRERPQAAKVRLPSHRAKIIRRQRLIDLLHHCLEKRATIVTAPAGFGKTTLLVDFAQTLDRPVCWYSLDEGDRQVGAFLVHLIACLRQQFPSFGCQQEERLAVTDSLPAADIVTALLEECSTIAQPFLLIMDDFHHLDDASSQVVQVVEGWLQRLPENCHLLLASRTWPRISVLPLMTARQQVAIVEAPAFAFSVDEVKQLLNEALSRDIALDDAQYLADATEGWASALVLLADKFASPNGGPSLDRLKPTDTLYRYLDIELLSPLPQDLREFALACSILRTADPALCDELLAISDAEEKLARLDERNLMTSRGSFRFWALFRSFLTSKLRAERAGDFQHLHRRAAAIFEGKGNWQEAMYHYLEARAWDRVIALTEGLGRKLFEEGQWDKLADWLGSIPQEELLAQPKLVVWKAKILHYLNQLDAALELVARVLGAFEAQQDWVALADALIIKGMCLGRKGDYQEAKAILSRARALLLEHDGPLSLLTEARKELGITYGMCGEFDQALQELKNALDIYEAQGDVYNIAHVNNELGTALVYLGRLAEAVGYFERACARWVKLGNHHQLVFSQNNLGNLYYLQGEEGQAEEVFQQALAKAEEIGADADRAYLLASLADIRRDQGRFKEALELFKRSLELARDLDEARLVIYNLDAMANTYRLLGDLNTAEALAKHAGAEAEERGGLFEVGLCQLTEGLILRDRLQLEEAVASLEGAVASFKRGEARRQLALAYFHLAESYYSLRRRRLALEYLEMSAKLAGELGYHYFLAVEARRAPQVVQYGAANRIADGFYSRLLQQVKVGEPTAVSAEADDLKKAPGRLPRIEAFGFGHLRVSVDGREVSDLEWRSEKSKEMFFYFLAQPQPLRKEEVVAALWPDIAEDKANSAFHSTLYRLRQALHPECLVKEGGRYRLNPQGQFWYDVQEFQKLVREAEALPKDSPERLALLEKALSLYRGSFAQDFYAEWTDTIRWHLEEQYLRLLAVLAAAYAEQGQYSRSIELCQQALAADELNEAAWYRLMGNYVAAGELEAAKFCYRRYAELLWNNLEGEPPEQFQQLMRQVLSLDKDSTASA